MSTTTITAYCGVGRKIAAEKTPVSGEDAVLANQLKHQSQVDQFKRKGMDNT
jgi:hypothetical protein